MLSTMFEKILVEQIKTISLNKSENINKTVTKNDTRKITYYNIWLKELHLKWHGKIRKKKTARRKKIKKGFMGREQNGP